MKHQAYKNVTTTKTGASGDFKYRILARKHQLPADSCFMYTLHTVKKSSSSLLKTVQLFHLNYIFKVKNGYKIYVSFNQLEKKRFNSTYIYTSKPELF